jgi:hypothetical protein
MIWIIGIIYITVPTNRDKTHCFPRISIITQEDHTRSDTGFWKYSVVQILCLCEKIFGFSFIAKYKQCVESLACHFVLFSHIFRYDPQEFVRLMRSWVFFRWLSILLNVLMLVMFPKKSVPNCLLSSLIVGTLKVKCLILTLYRTLWIRLIILWSFALGNIIFKEQINTS